MSRSDHTSAKDGDLERLEVEALVKAVVEADADFRLGAAVDHDIVCDWLRDLADGIERAPPDPAVRPRR
jgi:hypothetical protein